MPPSTRRVYDLPEQSAASTQARSSSTTAVRQPCSSRWNGPARAIGRVAPLIVPGAELAVIRHQGPIATIDLTYGDLGAYVITHEIGVQGPLRENYVRGFLDTEDAQTWETEIGWPIFRSDTHAPEPDPG